MNILLIVSWYKTQDNPMIGSFFEEQARALIKKGHKVILYYPEYLCFSSSTKKFTYDHNDNGIRTIQQGIKALIPYSRKFNYNYFATQAYKLLRRKGILENIDIVHAHTFRFAGVVALKIKSKTKLNYIVTEHFSQLTNEGGIHHKVDLEYAKLIFENSKCNFAVSNFFKKQIIEKLHLSPTQFQVLPNMVNETFLNEKLISNKPLILFSVAFFTKNKNISLQLKAFKLFLQTHPDSVLKIGGDGPEQQNIMEEIKNLNISRNVILLGLLTRQQVLDELKTATLFIHSSLYETFGVVLIEALAMGVPVVALDSGGPRDIINKENGILVKENNVESFCEAMLFVIKNGSSYPAIKLRNDCANKFSEHSVISMIEKQYKIHAK